MQNTLYESTFIKQDKKFIKLIFIGTLINVLFTLSQVYGQSIVAFLGVALVIAYSMVIDEYSNLLLLVFLIPNQRDIVLLNSDITLINIVIAILFLKLVSRKGKLDILQIITVMAFAIYSLNIAIRLNTFSTFFIVLKSSFLIVTLTMFIRKYSADYKLYLFSIKSLIFGAISAGLVGLVFNFNYLDRFYRFTAGVNNDPNIYGSILSFSFANLMILVFSGRLEKEKWHIPSLVLVIMFGLLTQSRAFILTCLIILLFYFSFQKSIKNKVKIIMLGLTAFLVLFIVYTQFPDSALSKIMYTTYNRFANPRNNDISGGRINLWMMYIGFLTNNIEYLFLGIGSSFRDFGFSSVAHNMLIDTFVIYGAIGFIFICMLYFLLWKRVAKDNIYKRIKFRNRIIFITPLLAMMVSNSTLYDFFGIGFIIQVLISFLCMAVIPIKQSIYTLD